MDKLDLILQKIEGVDRKLEQLDERISRVETRLDKLEVRMDGLEEELENRIYPAINIIAGNHLDLYRHLKTVIDFRPSHDALEIRVGALEYSMGRVKEVIANLKTA